MGPHQIQPETLEERVVYWTIVATWGWWLLGALYIVGAVIGYILLAIFAGRLFGFLEAGPARPNIPVAVLLWIAGAMAMLVALIVGHFDFELGMGKMIKSIVGWGKGWALIAVLPLAGALLSIRAAVLYRATGVLALQTLLLIPLFLLAGFAGLPKELYVSPLSLVGGPGKEFFDVTLYAIDDTDGRLRWRFFGPWSTASAFLASVSLFFALFERSMAWKLVGIAAALAVCWMAGSRSSIVAIPVILGAVFFVSNLHRPSILLTIGFVAVAGALMLDHILLSIEDGQNSFNSARAASSRVRATLNNIGYHRWYSEAFWFGHGTVQPGPHLVQFMPIGSHHTWYGLLFVKGAVGFLALAIPLGWSVVEFACKSQADRVARGALCVVLAIAMFSFADNLEIVTYLVWPALLLVGIAHRRRFHNPYVSRLGVGGRWLRGDVGFEPAGAT